MRGPAGVGVAGAVLALLPDRLDALVERYIDLHRHPELSTHEVRTAGIVADGLTRPLIAVRVTDKTGRPVRAGTLIPFTVDQPYTAAVEAELDSDLLARRVAREARAIAERR